MTSSDSPNGAATAPGTVLSFTAGLGVALVACGGLLAARLSLGDVKIGVLAQVLLTLALVAVMHGQGRPVAARSWFVASKIAAQVVGAALGIAIAHFVIRSSSLAAVPWLSERPAQLVNDFVAVFAPLAVVWASSRRPPSTLALVATLAVVTAYRATGFMWHLDGAAFSYSVQDLVTGEFAGSAIGITAFRLLAPG